MIPTNTDNKSKRKQDQVDDRNTEDYDGLPLNQFEQDLPDEVEVLGHITETRPAAMHVNRSSSSSPDWNSAQLYHIGTTSDYVAGLNISNDQMHLNNMTDRVELPASENMIQVIPSRSGRPPIQLYLTCDDDAMSRYQCLVRKQIELFEAEIADVESNPQGRNKPIVLGQVGIRCRHCSMLPPNQRQRGATYYPSKLDGIYQAANNLAIMHLGEHCNIIEEQFRSHLLSLRNMPTISGCGKKIWAERAAILGVFEDLNGLRFEPTINYRQRNYLEI